VSGSKTHNKLTRNNLALAQNLLGSRQFSYEPLADFLGSFDSESYLESTFAVASREI
jgi:hypothetical protein